MNKFFEAMGRNVLVAALMVVSVIFITYQFAVLPPAIKDLAGVVLWSALFVLAYVVLTLDAHKALLVKLLEPKCGYGVSGHVQTATAGKQCAGGPNAGCSSVSALIFAQGKPAPRVTPVDIEANIVSERYFTAADGLKGAYRRNNDVHEHGGSPSAEEHSAMEQVTICVLWLRNGTKVVGVNYGAIDPAHHSAEEGKKSARAEAIEQIWPLMGYELRTKLAQSGLPEADAQAGFDSAPRPVTT